jgi:nickel/cobalt exporter
VVWLLALAALSLGNELMAEQAEPYFMLLSAVVVLGVAVWMWLRTRRDIAAARHESVHLHDHDHDHDHGHGHGHGHGQPRPSPAAFQDAHERAHAEDIARRFQGQTVTTGQIAVFGLTAGLVPCPASVTILMICLHLKRLTLGLVMVASFSLGLAIALVGVGVLAAWGAKQVERQWGNGRWGEVARQMPYLSSALMAAVALWMGAQAAMRIAGL